MISLEDIRPLSEFQRNAKTHIRRLAKTGRPEVLTVNGKASVVVQDAAAYEKLLEELENIRTGRALKEAEQGDTLPLKQAMTSLRKRADKRKALPIPFLSQAKP